MNKKIVHNFMTQARSCALVMLESADYINDKLADVRMSAAHRAQTEAICNSFIGTKHDIFTELSEMYDLLNSEGGGTAVLDRAKRIVSWFREDLAKMHELVMGLEVESKSNLDDKGAYILVAESAVNILAEFNGTLTALEALRVGTCEANDAQQDAQADGPAA